MIATNARAMLRIGATLRIGVAGALLGCLLACGGESEPAAPAAAPAAPAPAASEPSAPDKPVTSEDLYEWDPTAGAPRDLAADSAECEAQVTGQGLGGVAQHIQCMRQKGWKTRPPAS